MQPLVLQPQDLKTDALMQQAAAAPSRSRPHSWSVALQQRRPPPPWQPGPATQQGPAAGRLGRSIPRPPPLMIPQAESPPAVQLPSPPADLKLESSGSNTSSASPLSLPLAPVLPTSHAPAASAVVPPLSHPRATMVPSEPGSQALRRSTVQEKGPVTSDAAVLRPPGRLSSQRQSRRAPEESMPPDGLRSAARASQDVPLQQTSFAPAAELAPADVSGRGACASTVQACMRPLTILLCTCDCLGGPVRPPLSLCL